MLCDPCFCLFASLTAQRYKKNLTYTRIPPRKTLRELIFHPKNQKFHPKTAPKVTGKVTDKMTDKVPDKVTERVTEGAHQKVRRKVRRKSTLKCTMKSTMTIKRGGGKSEG